MPFEGFDTKAFLLPCAFPAVFAVPALALGPSLGCGWDGRSVPAGQQCRLFGGDGATPPMTVSGAPEGTRRIVMEFNDKSYQPLSTRGGHGVLACPASGTVSSVPALPGMTARLPGGAQVVKKARSSEDYASPAYLPPCPGGRGDRCTVDVKAVAPNGKVLAQETNVSIERYWRHPPAGPPNEIPRRGGG